MRLKLKILNSFIALLFAALCNGQTKNAVVEYLNVPGPVALNKTNFNLAWTSHPSETYYKQEYVPAGQNVEKFSKMVSVELLVSDATVADLANAKVEELTKMKATNPVINYEIFRKDGEILLDFLISQNSSDGKKVDIIERNVYRYTAYSGKEGKVGVVLFAASERAYGDDVERFLLSLKKNKPLLLNAVGALTLPKVSVKK